MYDTRCRVLVPYGAGQVSYVEWYCLFFSSFLLLVLSGWICRALVGYYLMSIECEW